MTVFDLTQDEVYIGRHHSNHISINDLSVSRQHCVLCKEGEQFRLHDLDSENKTFVNDRLVGEGLLEHGDRVRVGNSLFVYLLNGFDVVAPVNKIHLSDDALVTKTAVKMQVEDALSLMARDLSALLEISMAINSLRGLENLQQQLLERIFDVVPAERGAILLAAANPGEFESMFGLERDVASRQVISVSRTIAQQVLREGVAVLSNDVVESAEFNTVESLITSRIQALLCVPLLLLGKAFGIIYLDAQHPRAHFDRGQLQMVTAIANIAASALANARHVERLENENQRLRTALSIEYDMVGKSSRMSEVYQLIAKVAPTDVTVLINGESGTGKELAARAIHKNSLRAGKPVIALNCAAIPETLLESELFGYEKGAFTNARTQKKGQLEIADGGTIFFDEVGEMSHATQIKLLRVLQEQEFVRVGGTQPVKIDVRLVAATNKDMEKAVRQGTFRRDLYFRLNVFPLTMPPLRERHEDVLLLALHFISKHSKRCKRQGVTLSPEALSFLINHHWPGNVRELENAIETALVLCSSEQIAPRDLPRSLTGAEFAGASMTYKSRVEAAKKRIILDSLEQAGDDFAAAAQQLDIHPNNLHRLIRTLGLKNR
jgi:transcriptional regulator with GAF, ATPase, and Fis domain